MADILRWQWVYRFKFNTTIWHPKKRYGLKGMTRQWILSLIWKGIFTSRKCIHLAGRQDLRYPTTHASTAYTDTLIASDSNTIELFLIHTPLNWSRWTNFGAKKQQFGRPRNYGLRDLTCRAVVHALLQQLHAKFRRRHVHFHKRDAEI